MNEFDWSTVNAATGELRAGIGDAREKVHGLKAAFQESLDAGAGPPLALPDVELHARRLGAARAVLAGTRARRRALLGRLLWHWFGLVTGAPGRAAARIATLPTRARSRLRRPR